MAILVPEAASSESAAAVNEIVRPAAGGSGVLEEVFITLSAAEKPYCAAPLRSGARTSYSPFRLDEIEGRLGGDQCSAQQELRSGEIRFMLKSRLTGEILDKSEFRTTWSADL
jgi:hypothetical protein